MLVKKDFAKLRIMFGELLSDTKVEFRDEMRSLIHASETRVIRRMDRLRDEIVSDIGGIIDEGVLPQIAELQIHTGLRPKRRA